MSVCAHAAECSAAPGHDDVCDCCQHGESQSDEPGSPTNDEDGCDCICEGAIFSASESGGSLNLAPPQIADSFDQVVVTGSPAVGLSQLWDDVASAARPARAVRLAMHSLQV